MLGQTGSADIGLRAYLGSAKHARYVASKAAVVRLTRTMAMELSSRQISVSAIAPRMVRTPLLAGISEDIAQAVAFFAGPSTQFITGQVLVIDRGRSFGRSS
jgi:3-oxoacyl-[acyl-carrier protein] reductase